MGRLVTALTCCLLFLVCIHGSVGFVPLSTRFCSKRQSLIKKETFGKVATLAPSSAKRVFGQQTLWTRGLFAEKDDGVSLPMIDTVLSRLTSAFPLFVLSFACIALKKPSWLLWVNRGNLISTMLALVMVGTGMTLEKKDFANVLTKKNASVVPLGVACQYGIMPLAAWLVGRRFLLPHDPYLYLGFILVGCSPGGTASNLVSLIAKANVALSVLLTACSTILASIMTPLLVKLLLINSNNNSNNTATSSIPAIHGLALCVATAKVVLVPVLAGMLINTKAPSLSKNLSRFTPFASVLLVSLICGGVISQNSMVATAAISRRVVSCVLALHGLGFWWGYLVPKRVLACSETTSRTISIETGMQNSALAVVLAQSISSSTVASLPGAISATAHSCLGSILAAFWRRRRSNDK